MAFAGATTAQPGCWAFLPRSHSGYGPLYASESDDESEPATATVVVGKARKEFTVDRRALQQEPLRVLLAVAGSRAPAAAAASGGRRKRASRDSSSDEDAIFVDVDEILFEHVLWLVQNGDCPAVLGLHLRDIIEFYAHDDS